VQHIKIVLSVCHNEKAAQDIILTGIITSYWASSKIFALHQ
ncbi:uncharacterized protein METZ01_LOCUS114362, partial [marine metagenome]